jgi:hypothetical protein
MHQRIIIMTAGSSGQTPSTELPAYWRGLLACVLTPLAGKGCGKLSASA